MGGRTRSSHVRLSVSRISGRAGGGYHFQAIGGAAYHAQIYADGWRVKKNGRAWLHGLTGHAYIDIKHLVQRDADLDASPSRALAKAGA